MSTSSDDEGFLEDGPPLPPRYRFRDLILGDFILQGDDDRSSMSPPPVTSYPDSVNLKSRPAIVPRAVSERFQVEFFTNERSLKERLQLYFIKNQRSSLRIRLFNIFLKLLTCILYVVRVEMEESRLSVQQCFVYGEGWLNCNQTNHTYNDPHIINWNFILWVHREPALYYIQVTVAIISLLQACLMVYLGYKGNILQQVLSWEIMLEMITSLPFLATLASPAHLSSLFIPVFLNSWLAKSILENMFNDVHRVMNRTQSPLSQQLTVLIATIITIFFISSCGIQHLQRGSQKNLTLFDSLWFVVVSFSTVGYGDITPDIWPSRLFMMIMIIVSLTVLPMQLEKLAYTWVERKKRGGSYSRHRAETEKHVVVCATHLHTDTVMDFLNEFYAHPKLQGYYVVLLSPSEMEEPLKIILQIPIWAQRVIYIKGSALKDSDLQRCRMSHAEGCFILASRTHNDRTAADQHTILRSWAIRDHSPAVEQYVQLFRPENKFHVKFAKHVVCEDEIKYALLSYNCLCPGTSTLVTLLLHTSRGKEGESGIEEWQKLYGKCSGNEIYEIKLSKSQFFRDYCDKSFSYASFNAHKKYGVCLIGVQSEESKIRLNPGPQYNLKESDTLFYLSITKEEHSSFSQKEGKSSIDADTLGVAVGGNTMSVVAGVGSLRAAASSRSFNNCHSSEDVSNGHSIQVNQGNVRASLAVPDMNTNASNGVFNNFGTMHRRPSIAPVAEQVEEALSFELTAIDISKPKTDKLSCPDFVIDDYQSPNVQIDDEPEDPLWQSHDSRMIEVNVPPIAPYIGKGFHLCYLLKNPRSMCCLQLAKACRHCKYQHAKEYNWKNNAIIIASETISNGLYNFILPLRSQCLKQSELRPIVLLLESEPDRTFKEAIRHFPMVYWITGSIDKLDDWLRAGVTYADNIVVVNKETSNSKEDEYLSDCNTIVAVQTLFRLFPAANIITELSQATNMRFMQFRADDSYSLQLAKLEKEVKRKGSHMSYMFRLPFSAGKIFSASMLDTLLYQAFVKEYLINIVRLLIGIDQEHGSGFLTCVQITTQDAWIRTYGRLYQKLCSTNGAIPIGIYRTQFTSENSIPVSSSRDMCDNNSECGSMSEKEEISQLVKGCMKSLNLPPHDYDLHLMQGHHKEVSYVITNPSFDLQLEVGDIIYVLRPASKQHTEIYEARRPDVVVRSPSVPICFELDTDDAADDSDPFLLGKGRANSCKERGHKKASRCRTLPV